MAAVDAYGKPVIYYGNSGRQTSTTDQLKTKLGYEWGDWLALATVAYEERQIDALDAQNYLRDASGNPVWSGRVDLVVPVWASDDDNSVLVTRQREGGDDQYQLWTFHCDADDGVSNLNDSHTTQTQRPAIPEL